MNSIKPFLPGKGLVPTIRNITVLGGDIPDASAAFRDEEFTFKQESGITGDILLTLLEAMKQFRASSGGNISVSGNTSVIRSSICTIVNNFRGAAGGSSVDLNLLLKKISEVFSAEAPSQKSAEELIARLSEQIERLGISPAKRSASVMELRGGFVSDPGPRFLKKKTI